MLPIATSLTSVTLPLTGWAALYHSAAFAVRSISFFDERPLLVVGDRDAVGLSGRLLRCRDIEDTVRINVKNDVDLQYTTTRRRDAGELEPAEKIVAARRLAFTLVHLDEHTGSSSK